MRHLVRGGVPLMLLMVFNQIYSTIDIPILAALTTPTVVGWYVLAYRWAAIPIFIANVVNGSFYPEMSKHGPGGGPEFTALVNRALKLVLVVLVPAGIGLAVVAGDLLHLPVRQRVRRSRCGHCRSSRCRSRSRASTRSWRPR